MPAPRKAVESVVASVPAPIGGWNARDSLANMDERDAVFMTNFFPATTSVNLRNGYTNHVTGIGTQVESLMVYNGATASSMFAATADGKMYNVTTAGAVGAASLTGLSNGRWQYINMASTTTSYMISVNGQDKAVFYNGTSFARDGDGATYDITGVDSADCININLHKNRVWLIEEDTLDAWYLGTNAISGAATKFSLRGVAMMGGALVAMATWTIDAGYGVNDMAVFITTEGEVIVYNGTDPSSANTWALVGVWRLGTPIGTRCWLKYAGDLLLITQDGVLPMSAALQSSRVNPKVSLTDKIQYAMSQAVSVYGGNFGWELAYFPQQNQLYLNVPVITNDQQEQYVMNTITKAWCNFTGWEANCFAILNDDMYFGSNGVVCKAWDSLADNGVDITGTGLQAFNYLGNRSQQKQFTMIRPTFFLNGSVDAFGGVNVDFDTQDVSTTLQTLTPNASLWDVALWDSGTWSTDTITMSVWQGANGIGYCCAPRIKATVNGETLQWASTDIVFRRGAVL